MDNIDNIAELTALIINNTSLSSESAQILAKAISDSNYSKTVIAKRLLVQNHKGVCSECHRLDEIDPLAHFCRYCGAKIEEYDVGYHEQDWISVEDRLPTHKDGKVLIYTAYGISIAERTVNNRWRGDCAIPKLITHWMLLPEAPKMKGGAE